MSKCHNVGNDMSRLNYVVAVNSLQAGFYGIFRFYFKMLVFFQIKSFNKVYHQSVKQCAARSRKPKGADPKSELLAKVTCRQQKSPGKKLMQHI